ncbi:hypothetical protein Acsp05_31980 [Actinokineospora sp. NBRC 105648]|nr:hypothetical protein Acsp05_31980 [Actinokineospora sp. NBRC 105648]
MPARVFAPYFEAWTGENPATLSAASGAKYLTMAFLQTASPGSCTALWNGDTSMPISSSTFGAAINTIKANGGDVIPSFGGYTADTTGTELADSCTDVNKIAGEYQRLITTYDISRIDLDIEIDSLDNTAGVDRRNKAIKIVKDWAAANGRPIQFSYTLPTTTSGLAQNGVALLRNAVQNNAQVDVVNIMTFDYYDNAGTHNMAKDTETASQGLVNTLAQLYPSKTQAQLWGMVGVTEMIGVDDFGPAETFTTADATTVYNWALAKGINTLSFWALQRDNGSCPGGAAADNCSGIAQDLYYFSKKFAPFTSGSVPTNDFSVAVSPASVTVNAGASATATVSTAVTSGSAQSVALTAGPAQGGVTATLNPTSVTAGGTSTLTFAAAAGAASGTYTFTVTGTGASGTHTATVSVKVNGTTPANDFSLAVNPTSGSVNVGASVTATVNTAVTSGSAQSVALTSGPAQGGVTASLSPTTVTAGGTSTLTLAASATATPGTYTFTVTGTGPNATHTATYAITVNGTQPSGAVVNGGFESGAISPWTAASGSSVVSTPVHSGAKALSVTPSASGTGEVSQSVTLLPNKAYTLKAWVRGNYAYVGVTGGATASAWTSTSDWKQLSIPFTTGSNGTVKLYVHGWYGQSAVYADDFTIS